METVWRSLSSVPRPRDRGRPVGGRRPRHEFSPATADLGGEMATGQVVYVTPPAVPGKLGSGDGSQGHPFHSVGAAIARAKANGGGIVRLHVGHYVESASLDSDHPGYPRRTAMLTDLLQTSVTQLRAPQRLADHPLSPVRGRSQLIG